MSEPVHIPATSAALSAQVNGNPIKWRTESDAVTIIIFEDGRKLTFNKTGEEEIPAEFAEIIHTKAEAVEAVKTLPPKSQRKK